MKKIITQYFIRAVVLVLFNIALLSCAGSQAVTARVSTSTNQLRIGLWKLSGIDANKTIWSADLIVQSVRDNICIGYFDWYSGVEEFYRGREYFEGTYLEARQRINFRGTRLENVQEYKGRRLILGVYQARLSDDGLKLYDGFWNEGIPATWQAEFVNGQSFIN